MKSITLIGTIHQSTKRYSALDLFNILEKIRPDVIFEELPLELSEDQEKIDIPFSERCEFQERAANHWYYKRHGIPIVPVDLPNRNKLYNSSGDKDLYLFWSQLLSDKRLNLEEKAKLEKYFSTLDEQRALCENNPEKEINSTKMDNLIAIKKKFLTRIGMTLIDKYSGDKKLKNQLEELNYWTRKREEFMVKEIIKWMQKYKNAAFPVGAEHRLGLREKINQKKKEIRVLEYWQE